MIQADWRDIRAELPKVDLVLTDPPYGLKGNAARDASRGVMAEAAEHGDYDWDDVRPDAVEIESVVQMGDQAIVWGGNYFELPPAPFWMVWDKMNGRNDFADCELAWTNIPGAVRQYRHMWHGMMRDSERGKKVRVHPTQKPISLMRWCLSYAPRARMVIDPYMGSGSTGIACLQRGLGFIGVERDPRYFEIACERVRAEAETPTLFDRRPDWPDQKILEL